MTEEEAKNYSMHGDQEGFYYQEARERIRDRKPLSNVHWDALVSANRARWPELNNEVKDEF